MKPVFLCVGIRVCVLQMGSFQKFGIHLLTEIKNSIQNCLIVFQHTRFEQVTLMRKSLH